MEVEDGLETLRRFILEDNIERAKENVLEVIIISNTRESVSSHFQTRRRELKIRRAAEYF